MWRLFRHQSRSGQRDRERGEAQIQAVAPDHSVASEERAAHNLETAPSNMSRLTQWIDWFATPRGAAAIALGGLLVSIGSLLDSITRISILGPIVFAVLIWLSWRRQRKVVAAAAALALVVSIALFTRAYTKPANSSFFYGGALMDTSGTPFFGHPGIPLTDDPSTGREYTTIYPPAT